MAGGDTITLKKLSKQETHEGRFKAFKNNRFYFQPAQGRKLHEQRNKVEQLTITPPARVTVKKRGKKKMDGLKLKGYTKPNFLFEKDGKEITMPGMQVTIIDMGLDFRNMTQDPGTSSDSISGKDVDIEELLKPGVTTIVHFHLQSNKPNPALRMENYVTSLPDMSKGKVAVVRVDLNGWKDPAAKKYGITSAPQFWFYNRKCKLVRKLTERFTSDDIDSALKAARRGTVKTSLRK